MSMSNNDLSHEAWVYGSAEQLDTAIKNWQPEPGVSPWAGLFKLVRGAWNMDYGDIREETDSAGNVLLCFITGGWSDNEDLLEAMYANRLLHATQWHSSYRGGLVKYVLGPPVVYSAGAAVGPEPVQSESSMFNQELIGLLLKYGKEFAATEWHEAGTAEWRGLSNVNDSAIKGALAKLMEDFQAFNALVERYGRENVELDISSSVDIHAVCSGEDDIGWFNVGRLEYIKDGLVSGLDPIKAQPISARISSEPHAFRHEEV